MQATVKRWFGKFPDMGDVIARFPVAVLAMAVFTLLIIFREVFTQNEHLARLAGGIIIASYLSISAVLAAETHGRKPSAPLQIGFFVVILPLAWFSKGLQLNIPMAIGAAVLLLGNAVIWRQARDDLHVWDFTHKLWTGAMFATVGSIIFALGLLAITAALKSLFGLKMNWLMEDFLFPIGLGFLAPLYWMATLPPVDEDYSELYDNPSFVSKAVAFLGTWLLSPLTLIYALILLAYGVKIVLSGELPNGEIAQLTSPFLIFGTLTWLVLDPPFTKHKVLAKLFRKLWWPVSVPAALLLAVAVFVRIGEYGYTPERAALTALVVWALSLALWFTFAPKEKRDIRLIPGFAAVLLTLGTFGAGWVSLINQGARFETNLKTAGIVSADGSIAPISDMDAARRAKGALRYLVRNGGITQVKKTLSQASIAFSDDTLTFEGFEKVLGLNKVSILNRWSRQDEVSYSRNEKSISIDGFDTLRGPYSFYSSPNKMQITNTQDALNISLEAEVLSLKIKDEVINYDVRAWINTQNFTIGNVELNDPFIVIVDRLETKVVLAVNSFNSWTETNDEGEDVSRLNMDFYVLTRGID